MPSISFHPPAPTPSPALRVGQIWKRLKNDGVFILADLNTQLALVCLNDGRLWNGPYDDIKEVFGSKSVLDFALVSQPFTVTP